MPSITSEGEPGHRLVSKIEVPKSPLEIKLDEVRNRTPRQRLAVYQIILREDGDDKKSENVGYVREVYDKYLDEATFRVAQEELAKEQSSGLGE